MLEPPVQSVPEPVEGPVSTTSAAPEADAISIRDLSLVFPTADQPVTALSHVDLSIRRGDFVSFIGPSGCGKTTLMRVIADLVQPTSGTVTVNGVSPAQARQARAYGYVFQAPALFAWRTVRRNVMLPLEITGVPAAERQARAARYLGMVGLEGFERKFPGSFPGACSSGCRSPGRSRWSRSSC